SEAVLSATPSITPRLATEALSVPVTNSGSTGMIISVETSVRRETQPSATTLRGMGAARRGPSAPGAGGAGTAVSAFTAREPSTAPGAPCLRAGAEGLGVRAQHRARPLRHRAADR